MTVLPRRSGFDEASLNALFFEELDELFGSELRTIIKADDLRFAVNEEEPFELFDEIAASNRRLCLEQQVLSGCNITDIDRIANRCFNRRVRTGGCNF